MGKHPVIKILKIIIIIFALATFIIVIHNHSITHQEKQATQNREIAVQRINESSKKYNVNKIRTKLGSQAPNITNDQISSNKRLKMGLNLAFSGKMNKRNIIQNDLGALSNRVLQITQKKGSATKIQSLNIGYGEYNIDTKAMPVHIVVKYLAGKNKENASYILTYKPQASYNKQYSLLSYSGNAYN